MKHRLVSPCPSRNGEPHCWEEHDAPEPAYPRLHRTVDVIRKYCCWCGEDFTIEMKRHDIEPPKKHGSFLLPRRPPAA